MRRLALRIAIGLALLAPIVVTGVARAQPAPSAPNKDAPIKEMSASPGASGGEGGGFGRDVSIRPATKEDPFLQTIVGQPSGEPTGSDPSSRCLRMAWKDYTSIPGAPVSIVDVAVKKMIDKNAAMCVINGYVAPQVGFRLLIPIDTWNGKYMQNGCGGQCGGLIAIPCEVQVTRGYSCLAADQGHHGTTYDSVWAIGNAPAQIDRAWRSTHVAAIAGKFLTEDYFGKPPVHAYYQGASTGGVQGLVEVQRFPMDFDGIISGEGGPRRFYPPGVTPPNNGGKRLLDNGKPIILADEIRMIHKAVIDRCDAYDGLKDGIITDPLSCDFKPKSLLCAGPKTATCLTQKQVDALEAVYADGGAAMGSELGWIGAFVAQDGTAGRYAKAPPAVGPDNSFMEGYGPPNPDLSAFKARGGKFITYVGWWDETAAPLGQIEYYEKVERTMGGRAQTQDFARLFVIPGQSHIPGNIGAESIDYIGALEDWVEKGKAPDVLIGHKLKWISQMMGPMYLDKDLVPANYLYSRPQYPWPIVSRYKGKGDPDDAASFGPWDPVKKQWVKQ
jgi:feruloyl esterase